MKQPWFHLVQLLSGVAPPDSQPRRGGPLGSRGSAPLGRVRCFGAPERARLPGRLPARPRGGRQGGGGDGDRNGDALAPRRAAIGTSSWRRAADGGGRVAWGKPAHGASFREAHASGQPATRDASGALARPPAVGRGRLWGGVPGGGHVAGGRRGLVGPLRAEAVAARGCRGSAGGSGSGAPGPRETPQPGRWASPRRSTWSTASSERLLQSVPSLKMSSLFLHAQEEQSPTRVDPSG